jgi:uncharacterized membrane protein
VDFEGWIELAGRIIDAAGVAVVLVGAIAAAVFAVQRAVRRTGPVYRPFRRFLGRSILLGLELLVAADIVRTVAVTPTLQSVAVLAGIVLIRTFLSFSLEVEIEGVPPWRRALTSGASRSLSAIRNASAPVDPER